MNEETVNAISENAEAQDISDFIRGVMQEEKGIDNFFINIIREDSLKTGNLEIEELGEARLPLRTLLELRKDCEDIPSLSELAKDFEKQAKDLVQTSLSKDGFLIKSRITQNKSLIGEKKRRRSRIGLFGKKQEEE